MNPAVWMESQSLPVLFEGDAVVLGGSLAGIAAALKLALAGQRVMLVEPRTYLGREITATLRPWIAARPAPPQLITALIQAAGAPGAGEGREIALGMDLVKLFLEDALLQAGVKLLYASLPVGVLNAAGHAQGVVIGNKSGRQIVACPTVIDATHTALALRLAGDVFEPVTGQTETYFRTLEFLPVVPAPDALPELPADLGIEQVWLHPGSIGRAHLLLECQLSLPRAGDGPLDLGRREWLAREATMRLTAYLKTNRDAFAGAGLAHASHDLHGPATTRLAGPHPDWAANGPMGGFAGHLNGLWALNEAARLDDADLPRLRDPLEGCRVGEALAETILSTPGRAPALPETISPPAPAADLLAGLQVKEPAQPQRGRRYPRRTAPPVAVPVLHEAGVLVAGGGTSGAIAAITAAREGVNTVLVDMNPGLGGTGTYGGVHSYWFGNREGYPNGAGFSGQVVEWVEQAHRDTRHPLPAGEVPKWNIEVKAYALGARAREAGVEQVLNAIIIGAVVEGQSVRGLVAATQAGPVALLADITIDATGDGDLACYAGAPCVYGAARDHATMWYSLAQFKTPGATTNNFTSTVDVGNVEDYTRAILAGRRRSRGGYHDHGIYVAPRESRHVLGEVVLTMTDQLLKRCWPDVINIAFSNHDIKGQSTSDWIRAGLIPPNLEIEIPYRALLPRGLENILVVGKAISAEHDALPAIRMQADLENLGGAAALAAALCAQTGSTPRRLDVAELQRRLAASGVLPEPVLNRRLRPFALTPGEVRQAIARLDAARPLYAYSDMPLNEVFPGRIPEVDLCCAGLESSAALAEELRMETDPARRERLAVLLALAGSAEGAGELAQILAAQLSGGALPQQRAKIRHAILPPDQGAMPEAAYLLYALGMTRDARALPVWRTVAELLERATAEDLRHPTKGIFYYVDALCYGIERLPLTEAAPLLETLRQVAPFHNQGAAGGFQPDFFQERQAYLELVIARTLARCGSPRGYLTLAGYLTDARALLAEQAHSELQRLAGVDLGKDPAAWAQWIEMNGETLAPQPVTDPPDPVRAWAETILVA